MACLFETAETEAACVQKPLPGRGCPIEIAPVNSTS